MTARAPSAVEVIAEALPHREWCNRMPVAGVPCVCHYLRVATAENVCAAIRAMTPEQQAEVIGGEVGYWSFHQNGAPYSHIQPFIDIATEQVTPPHMIAAYLMRGGTRVGKRALGPWRDV